MQVVKSLHDLLSRNCPDIHAARMNALMTNVRALLRGQKLTVTGLGRAPRRSRNTKHDIKQSDRLIGNTHLALEREALYRALSRLRYLILPLTNSDADQINGRIR